MRDYLRSDRRIVHASAPASGCPSPGCPHELRPSIDTPTLRCPVHGPMRMLRDVDVDLYGFEPRDAEASS